jgi:hypothetical protein
VGYETALARQRLVLQTQYVDGIVGQVLDRLDDTGLAGDTAVVLTSDHGVGLRPGEEKRPITSDSPVAEAIYPDLLQVPLLIRAPGVAAGVVDDRNAMTTDVVPTLADLLDVELPWSVDGRSLFGRPRTTGERSFVQVLPRDETGAFGFEVTGTRGPAAIGPPVDYDGDATFADALDRNLDAELFAGAAGPHRAYRLSPAGDLVGSSIGDLEVADAASGVVEQEPPPAGFAPLRLRGRVVGAAAGPMTLAVVVDGVVAATVPTFGAGEDPHRFDLMLDHTVVGEGAGRATFYVVEGRAGTRVLSPLPVG